MQAPQQPQQQQQDAEEMKNVAMDLLQMNKMKYSRFETVMYIAGGCIAGVLGLTNFYGLLFYIVLSCLVSFFIMLKMKFNTKLYANTTPLSIILQGASSQAMSFVLFWSMAYALVYIY